MSSSPISSFAGVSARSRLGKSSTRQDRRSRSPSLLRTNQINKAADDGRSVVLLVGGTGHLGGIIGKHLADSLNRQVRLLLGGRSKDKGEQCAQALNSSFVFVDVSKESPGDIAVKLTEWCVDIVINAVGPFHDQQTTLLEAAIEARCHYLDVCDDLDGFATRAKEFHEQAVDSGSVCITTAGIFPGLSNLIAANLIEEGGGAEQVRMDYFMTNSGGFGPSVIISSMNGSVTPAVVFRNGKQEKHIAFTGRRLVDFGPIVGKRAVYHFALPECFTIQKVYKVPNVRAMFGIDPEFFNRVLLLSGILLRIFPQRWKECIANYAMVTVRPFDLWLGRTFAMRIAVLGNDHILRIHRQTFEDAFSAAGDTVVRQIMAVLSTEESLIPGVWFPEEVIKGHAREKVIEYGVSKSSHSDSTIATTFNGIVEDVGDLNLEEDTLIVWLCQRVLVAIPLSMVFVALWDWSMPVAFPLMFFTLLCFW